MTRRPDFPAARSASAALLLGMALVAGAGPTAGAQRESVLEGRVAGIKPEKHLKGAEIAIDSLKLKTRTDSLGAFHLAAIPAGTHAIRVQHEGYALFDTTLTFTGRDTLKASFLLDDAADTLDPGAAKMADFERRRARGLGWFLTRSDLEGAYDRELSEVLRRRIPGLALNRNSRGSGVAVASTRGSGSAMQQSSGDGYPPACYVQVYVDGVRVFAAGEGQPPVSINEWRTSDIEGVEYYPAMQQTPPEFAGFGAICGTLALWLRTS